MYQQFIAVWVDQTPHKLMSIGKGHPKDGGSSSANGSNRNYRETVLNSAAHQAENGTRFHLNHKNV